MSYIIPKYILTCEEFIENEDGSVSFLNSFETRTFRELPYEFDFKLIIGLEYSLTKKEKRKVLVRIVDKYGSNGSESGKDSSHDIVIDLRETKKNEVMSLVSKINVNDMLIEVEGNYTVLVYYDDKIIMKHDILITEGD